MLTVQDQLWHWVDCSSCDDAQKAKLRGLFRELDEQTAKALEQMIQEIQNDWVNPETGEAYVG